VLDLTGYLRRLGLEYPGPPSVSGLFAIHRAQVERVAYSTVDIYRGRPPSIDPYESAARVVETGRGGYCYHLNGALSVVLAGLGFDVHRHRGGVWSEPDEVPLQPYPNHLALTVHGLPSTANPGGVWFVDAGLGDALYEPIPVRSGPLTQTGFGYRMSPSAALADGWRFEHDPRGSFRAMDFEVADASMADFAVGHLDLSTSPASGFVKWLSVQRRNGHGIVKLISLNLRRVTAEGSTEERLHGSAQLRAVLTDEFGMGLDDIGPDEWSRIYQRVRAAQDEYDRSLEPADG
jgi:arylamine N-acetyltransferase